MGREVGGGLKFGNACTPVVDSCQCMAKLIQYVKKNKVKKKKQKKDAGHKGCFQHPGAAIVRSVTEEKPHPVLWALHPAGASYQHRETLPFIGPQLQVPVLLSLENQTQLSFLPRKRVGC